MCPKDTGDTIHIWSLDVGQHQSRLTEYQKLLTSDELAKALRFRKREDQERAIISHACLRHLLGQYLQLSPEQIRFKKNEFGKPYVNDNHACQFNLSHSHTRILIAITMNCPIGIDIEYMEKNNAKDKIAKRFFSKREYQEYSSLHSDEKWHGFYNAWTRKEAFLKAIGTGRHFPLSDFDVSLSPHLPAKIFAIRGTLNQEDISQWNLYTRSDLENYAMALCYKGRKRKMMNYEW